MLGTVKVRVLKPWGRYDRGAEIWPPAALRQHLLRCGIVELIPEDIGPDVPETTMVEPQVERAIRPRGRPRKDGSPPRRRGRPRKKVMTDEC
jgi:hypothetical protein